MVGTRPGPGPAAADRAAAGRPGRRGGAGGTAAGQAHAARRELAGRPTGGLRARVEALQRSIREQSWAAPGRRDVPVPAPAPLRAVRDSLAGAALVIYLRDGPVLRALVVVGDSARLRTVGGYAAAEEAVLRLRADLDVQAGRALPGRLAAAVGSGDRQDAAAVAAAVLSPLLADVGDRDLVVVPTGILTTVPWAVLPGCAGRPVTVAPSATAWHAARRRLRTARPRPGGPGRRPRPCWWPGRETPAATRRYGRSPRSAPAPRSSPARTRHPPRPSPRWTRRPSPTSPRTASIRPRTRCSPRLELAGGPLLGYDLQRAGPGTAMVVLSSCDLGLTDVRPGDETFGMVTALLNAGAATVVASVARVADDTAMAAMVGYHRAITAGRPPAAALAAALQGGEAAGFVCFGAG